MCIRDRAQTDEGHQEYYFGLLNEDEQRGYREILEGIRSFEDKFYLSLSGDNEIDRVYHAVLKDHPELFWVHNREKVYKTTYSGRDYCQFSPGYTYTEEQRQEITQAMENAYQEVLSQIPDGADDYTKVMTVYTYVIDNTEYVISDDDPVSYTHLDVYKRQSLRSFWCRISDSTTSSTFRNPRTMIPESSFLIKRN